MKGVCKVTVQSDINTTAIGIHIIKGLRDTRQKLKPQQRSAVFIKIEQFRALDACPIADGTDADRAARALLIMTDNADQVWDLHCRQQVVRKTVWIQVLFENRTQYPAVKLCLCIIEAFSNAVCTGFELLCGILHGFFGNAKVLSIDFSVSIFVNGFEHRTLRLDRCLFYFCNVGAAKWDGRENALCHAGACVGGHDAGHLHALDL